MRKESRYKGLTYFLVTLVFIFSVMLVGCRESAKPNADETETGSEQKMEQSNEPETIKPETPKKTDLATELLNRMTLEEKVYQLFFVTPEQLTGASVVTAAGNTTKECIQKYPVGGVIYFSQNIKTREQTSTMLKNLQSYAKIPVFTGVDEEGGTVSRIGRNASMATTKFPNMMTIGNSGNPEKAYEVGYTIGSECSALGFNLDFAPVADIFSNPENRVIGDRSFGANAELVSEMVASCVAGFNDTDMLCTLKHFPGHGNTLTDSHYGAAATNKTLEELENEEFLPFKAGIKAGADFVMVGHILTPNITDSVTPAVLSKEMISLLRDELQFEGVIITDAMNMAAITDYYSSSEAAVKAIQAGVDMVLIPADFPSAVSGVFDALNRGELTEAMIDEHVNRILKAKIDNGLIKN